MDTDLPKSPVKHAEPEGRCHLSKPTAGMFRSDRQLRCEVEQETDRNRQRQRQRQRKRQKETPKLTDKDRQPVCLSKFKPKSDQFPCHPYATDAVKYTALLHYRSKKLRYAAKCEFQM